MLGKIIFVLAALAVAKAQIPSLGWCPEFVPMANFDMNKFLGEWHEAERYFQLSEVASRCVTTKYSKAHDGKLHVSNQVTNRFTGVKQIVEGEIKAAASKAEEGKLKVQYTSIPLTPSTEYSVLETDYDNFAVLWSCRGIGPFYTQNAWLMTRNRQAAGDIIQKAYGVLDKYKISKRYFVKTDQADCAYLSATPAPENEKPLAEKPNKGKPSAVTPVEEEVEEGQNLRSVFIVPDTPSIIVEEKAEELKAAEKALEKAEETIAEIPAVPVVLVEPEVPVLSVKAVIKEENIAEEAKKPEESEPAAVETVPERIIKVAEQVVAAVEEPAVEEEQKAPVEPEPAANSETISKS